MYRLIFLYWENVFPLLKKLMKEFVYWISREKTNKIPSEENCVKDVEEFKILCGLNFFIICLGKFAISLNQIKEKQIFCLQFMWIA